ncbi:hypothetical protein AVEN_115611-1 [Araneus ventricosus]|uniref:Uncharacterized protein n=1 Tax=Araneus ventricosus TaxID=182803 RepID=A0A4Y2GX38_ARAVE|nr:hypothetical protein AVEN_115611-1 [Araneus ventricosus]
MDEKKYLWIQSSVGTLKQHYSKTGGLMQPSATNCSLRSDGFREVSTKGNTDLTQFRLIALQEITCLPHVEIKSVFYIRHYLYAPKLLWAIEKARIPPYHESWSYGRG